MSKTISICPNCGKLNRIDSDREDQATCGACKATIPATHGVSNFDTKTLLDFLKKTAEPVVVDFWAPWCGPCRAFAPTFSGAANELGEQLSFVKINTDENQDAGQIFGIRGIPTIIFFKNGTELTRQSGAMPEEMFKNWLKQNI